MAQTCHVLKYPTSISSNHVSYPIISYLLHRNCSEGTCDGCTFHFLWQSQHACPLCTTNHYREIISACIQGIQVLLHRHGHVGKNTFISSTSQNHRRQVHSSRAMATSSILFECFSNGIVSMISMQWSTRTSRHMFYNENLMFKKRTNMFMSVCFREPPMCGSSHCSVLEEYPCQPKKSVLVWVWISGWSSVFPQEQLLLCCSSQSAAISGRRHASETPKHRISRVTNMTDTIHVIAQKFFLL